MLSPLNSPHSAFCSPAMQIVPHLLLLVLMVPIAEFKLNLVNTNMRANELLTSKCNLQLANKGLANIEGRQILCHILKNYMKRRQEKVSEKGIQVVIMKPDMFKLFPEKAKNRALNYKRKNIKSIYYNYQGRVM